MADFPDSTGVRPTDLLSFPQTGESWELLQASGPAFRNGEGLPVASSVALLVSGDTFVQRLVATEQPLSPADLALLIADACAWPEEGSPRRPQRVVVSEPLLAGLLLRELAGSGVRAEAGNVVLAEEAYSHMMRTLVPPPRPDFLCHHSDAEVRAYFKAARRFYRARPWEAFPGERFLAFRVGEEPWRYVNVMGQEGEEFGLAIFRDWLSVCQFTNTAALSVRRFLYEDAAELSAAAFLAAGETESLQLDELGSASDDDAQLIGRLRIPPVWRRLYPLVQRFTLQGEEPARFSPAIYAALMQVIAERAERAHGSTSGRVSSVKAGADTPEGRLEVRYPARGDEGEERDDYYRIAFPFQEGELSPEAGRVHWIIAEAPGEAKWHRVTAAVQKVAEGLRWVLPWVHAVSDADNGDLLWIDQAPVKEPSPTVGQLARLEGVVAGLSSDEVLIEFVALPRPEEPVIRAYLTEQD